MNNEQEHIDHNEKAERKIIDDVKKYGFHMALLEDDGYLPAFAYSIGLFKSYHHPEVIIFGLKTEVMHHLLHNIGEKIKKGENF